jgi:hypothetical protein
MCLPLIQPLVSSSGLSGSEPWVTWEAVTGVAEKPYRELLRHTLANRALVYPSQGGRYRAEGCMALGVVIINDPLREPDGTPLYVGLPSAWDGDQIFSSSFMGEHLEWGL